MVLAGQTRVQVKQESQQTKKIEKNLQALRAENEAVKLELDTLKQENRGLITQITQAQTSIPAPADIRQISKA